MKMIYRYCITLFMLPLSFTVTAQTELHHYLKTAARNNDGLRATFMAYQAALQQVPQVGTLPDPTLSFEYLILPIQTRVGPQQARLGVSQMFPWFGTLKAQKNVAVDRAKARYEDFEQQKSTLFLAVKSVYYTIYFVQSSITITQENLRILNTFKQVALIKIETGKSSIVDEIRVEMEINELENRLAYLKDHQATLTVKFNSLLGASEQVPVVTPDTLWFDELPIPKSVLLDSVIFQHHTLKQLKHRIDAWEDQMKVAKKKGMPRFSLGVSYAIIGKSNNPNLGNENGEDALVLPKIAVSIPLYRKKYTAMIQEASLNMQATQSYWEDKKKQLIALFEKAYNDYRDAERRIALYRVQQALAKKALDVLVISYSGDGQNFEEVLRMESKELKYALEWDKANADKHAAIAFIDYLTGK